MNRTRWIVISLLLVFAAVWIGCRNSEPSNASAASSSSAASAPATSAATQPASQPASQPAADTQAPSADASFTPPVAGQGSDALPLRPPKGYKVAIVVFEDMQCPMCGHDEPLLKDAEKTYKIPLIRHDFPLPMHNWSFQAHILARYFDTKSKDLGEEFRHFIFTNQANITPFNLRNVADHFAADHGTSIPFAVDPTGKLKSEVLADFALGQRVGVQHTPTVYIVSDTPQGPSRLEVTDMSQLFQQIDSTIKQAGGTTETAEATGIKRPTRRPPTNKNAQ
ncbi:MAG: thioredoxin domain-containing protein [Terriglobia bacterium]|nr:thioredoxin domain-containing protein [Terriglobia bacterium]